MVSRAPRVQVSADIPKPAARTYQAVAVPHIDPQRKQSQASNFERLARDLGAFNSALQGFGSAVDAANKRAEARAKKLEAEKKAAEKRAARQARGASRRRSSGGRKKGRTREQWLEEKRAKFEEDHTIENKSGTKEEAISGDPGTAKETLGDENATKATYKELNDVKKGIGKQVYEEQAANLKAEAEAGYRVPVEDEHGEPEMDPLTGKPKTRLKTAQEIHHEAYHQQKAIEKEFGDRPLIRRHLKYQNNMNMQARMKGLKAAEEAERKTEALEFAQNTAIDTVKALQADGFDPDQTAKVAQAKAVQDTRLLYPNATREEIDEHLVYGLENALGSGDIEDARAVVNFLQGSPDAENGVAPWIKHPKHQRKATRIIRKASKIVAEHQANTKKQLIVKQYLGAMAKGETLPNIAKIEETLNGVTHRISEAEIESTIGEHIDQRFSTHEDPETGTRVPIPEEKRAAMLPMLIDAYQGVPNIESPALKRALAFTIKRDEEINPQDPAFGPSAAVAMTMMQKGPGGAALLKRHVGATMYKFYEQMWALRRNGLVEDDEVIPMMNTWLKFARKGGLRPTLGSMETKLTHLKLPGLTDTQREQVMNTARLAVLDKGLSYPEVVKVMQDQAETFREYNPQYNGVTVEMDPTLQMTPEEFEFHLDADVRLFRQKTGYDKDIYVERTGNMYYYHDKETGQPVLNPRTGKRVGFTRETLLERKKVMQQRHEAYKKAVGKEDMRYAKAGGHWGALMRTFGWQEALDPTPESELIKKQEAEMAEFEKIVNEKE